MKSEDGPFQPGELITRREWVELHKGISTALAKLDQVLELRREDNRKINRLEERHDKFEERQDRFDDRLAKVELADGKQAGKREIMVGLFGLVSGAVAMFFAGTDWREMLRYLLIKMGAQ